MVSIGSQMIHLLTDVCQCLNVLYTHENTQLLVPSASTNL